MLEITSALLQDKSARPEIIRQMASILGTSLDQVSTTSRAEDVVRFAFKTQHGTMSVSMMYNDTRMKMLSDAVMIQLDGTSGSVFLQLTGTELDIHPTPWSPIWGEEERALFRLYASGFFLFGWKFTGKLDSFDPSNHDKIEWRREWDERKQSMDRQWKSNYQVVSSEHMRALVESRAIQGETFTGTVERLANEIGVSRRTLFNNVSRGITLKLPEQTARTLAFFDIPPKSQG